MAKKLLTLLVAICFSFSLLLSLTVAVSADDESTRGGRFNDKRQEIAEKRQQLAERAREKGKNCESELPPDRQMPESG